jgi:NAD(P)-dependent dehydrogenase (short-subunit alcohol dehydrogenase family)
LLCVAVRAHGTREIPEKDAVMGRLDNKVAVITGAGSGMGRATARRFAQEGAAIVIADLNEEMGAETVKECVEAGGRAVFQNTDVTDEAQVKAAVARAVKEFGKLNVMFNNAGLGGAVGPLEEIKVENWDKTFEVLVRGVFLGMKHSIPEMRKAGGGSIISTASIAGIRGAPGLHAYCAAKAAVVNLTRSVAIEVGREKIRVNCICPGGILTPLIYNRWPGGYEAASQALSMMQPYPRGGLPEDIANAALYLASDESEFVSGHAMIVDGGLTAGGVGPGGRREQLPGLTPPSGFAGASWEKW